MNNLLRLNAPALMRNISRGQVRLIATESNKKAATTQNPASNAPTTTDFSEEAHLKSKNWVSYGWEHHDKDEDRARMKSAFFLTITLGIVVCGTVLAYEPDRHMRNWAQREGFLRLREREQAGLVPIDPNYYDPATIELPTEEELEGFEIIV